VDVVEVVAENIRDLPSRHGYGHGGTPVSPHGVTVFLAAPTRRGRIDWTVTGSASGPAPTVATTTRSDERDAPADAAPPAPARRIVIHQDQRSAPW